MKKLFLLLPLSITAQEQATTQNHATTQLNINLSKIYSISVDNSATIDLTTQDAFENGAQSENNVLNVFATHGYILSMQTSNQSFVNNVDLHFNDESIFPLSNTSTPIYQSNYGTLSNVFNLYYRIDNTNTEHFLNQTSDNLTTTITYTITAL